MNTANPLACIGHSLLAAALCAMGLLAHASSVTPGATDIVGEATLVIGSAHAVGADGNARAIERGAVIRIGDRIETAAGGHVHLRFIDGARLSVRPSSRLQVENYSKTGDLPALTAIKFKLEEGVVRSITGAWGEAARERFRLNTPVAAIGVKGTDFIVKSDANNTQATVYTGAILLTPLAGGCQSSLGPCLNGHEKLLSDDMKGQMLTLSRQQSSPQLVPAVDLLAQRRKLAAPDATATAKADAPTRAEPGADKMVIGEGRVADIVAVANAQQLASAPPQLVWARLAAVASDGDTISRSFAQAKENNRQSVAGNITFTLYRQATDNVASVLNSADSSANFRLGGGTAQLAWTTPNGLSTSEVAYVNSGNLHVDFARANYSTQLSVSSNRLGTDSLVSAGSIRADGVMTSNAGDTYTHGALSLDGREAAYLFQKSVATGLLTGITQWGR